MPPRCSRSSCSPRLVPPPGEIIPQAACSRYSLIIGSFAVPIVRVFMALFIPVTFPIAALLDWVLGRDIGTVYNQEELKRLIELHVEVRLCTCECIYITRTVLQVLLTVLKYYKSDLD